MRDCVKPACPLLVAFTAKVKSPWSYKKWSLETYIAFHALRTYVVIQCIKQEEEAIISLRIIRTKAKSVVRSDALKAAFREFIRRYKNAVVGKKKHYIIINCRGFFSIDAKALTYLTRHNEMRYLDRIDSGLKKYLIMSLSSGRRNGRYVLQQHVDCPGGGVVV
jgi:hypothetical protein